MVVLSREMTLKKISSKKNIFFMTKTYFENIEDFRAEGAFRLKQIAHSVSKKVGPTGYIDI